MGCVTMTLFGTFFRAHGRWGGGKKGGGTCGYQGGEQRVPVGFGLALWKFSNLTSGSHGRVKNKKKDHKKLSKKKHTGPSWVTWKSAWMGASLGKLATNFLQKGGVHGGRFNWDPFWGKGGGTLFRPCWDLKKPEGALYRGGQMGPSAFGPRLF